MKLHDLQTVSCDPLKKGCHQTLSKANHFMKLNNIQQCVRAFCLSGMWKSQSAFLNALLNEFWLAVNPNSLQSPRGMLDIGGMNCGECDMSTSGKQWDQSVCVCVFKKVVFKNCKEIWNHVGGFNRFDKICSSSWIFFPPIFGVKKSKNVWVATTYTNHLKPSTQKTTRIVGLHGNCTSRTMVSLTSTRRWWSKWRNRQVYWCTLIPITYADVYTNMRLYMYIY